MRGRLAWPSTPMARNSAALMANTIVTSGLGYLFWLIVVRVGGAATNGMGAAFASAVQLVTLLASVGAAAALIEWLPKAADDRQWREYVTTGMVVAILTSLLGAALLVGWSLTESAPVAGLTSSFALTAFVDSTLLFSVGAVIDYVCVAENTGGTLLARNALLTGVRIPAFLGATYLFSDVDALYLAWTVSALISLSYAYVAFAWRGRTRSLRPAFGNLLSNLGQMRHSLLGQHFIQVTSMIVGYALPLVVSAELTSEETGYYYITWMLGSVFFVVSPAVATALFAASASDPAATAALARRAIRMSLLMLTPLVVLYLLGGRLLLHVFGGTEYAQAGGLLLVVLTLSAYPDAITNVAVAVLRATGRMREAMIINGGMAAIALIGTWFTLHAWGIIAAGIWWIVGQGLGALWVLGNWHRIAWAKAEAP